MRRRRNTSRVCLDCGYCLFGPSKRCPECGRPFDPADPSSYQPPPAKWAVRQFVRFVFVVFVYGMAALLIGFALVIVAAMLT